MWVEKWGFFIFKGTRCPEKKRITSPRHVIPIEKRVTALCLFVVLWARTYTEKGGQNKTVGGKASFLLRLPRQ